MIRHISLDFWNTIGRANPEFAAIRNQLIADCYGIPVDDVRRIYTRTKKFLDNQHEQHQLATTSYGAWCTLGDEIDKERGTQEWYIFDDNGLIDVVNEAFLQNPPTLAKGFVEFTQKPRNFSISITSNTNFISGDVIKRYLGGLGCKIDFYIFSDIVGYSKPNLEMFDLVFNSVRLLKHQKHICKDEVLHIGDDDIFDILGAKSYGFNAHKIYNVDDLVYIMEEATNEQTTNI